MTPLPLSRFTLTSNGELVAEASDLRLRELGRRIDVHSESTGRIETFEHTQTEHDNEGDILAWHYRPLGALDKVRGLTIFND